METAISRAAENAVRRITLGALANLVAAPSRGGTPVDTGWARSNWLLSIGRPVAAPVGSRESVSAGEQQQSAAVIATRYRLDQGPVYLTNPVAYIGQLNRGHSPQARPGFIEAAILRAVDDAARGGSRR